ncbi:MAG: HPr family phosphocarrier protein [Elusimicrobiota bacterium]|jgi:phosphocarrier protein|nr:HPr family phosphocarrier protein [Elusimicrobiota bacterium]
MANFKYVITDEVGIHARPAGELVKKVKDYVDTTIEIAKGDLKADAKKLFQVLKLGVKKGEEVTVTIIGKDEEAVASELEAFFKDNL